MTKFNETTLSLFFLYSIISRIIFVSLFLFRGCHYCYLDPYRVLYMYMFRIYQLIKWQNDFSRRMSGRCLGIDISSLLTNTHVYITKLPCGIDESDVSRPSCLVNLRQSLFSMKHSDDSPRVQGATFNRL